MTEQLKAPFPWFGGKSRAAHLIWPRFGDVVNYVEPFAGSLAVLLSRPHEPRNETVNDLDCYLANFWRAVQADPDGVADAADWPVNEADLHARHRWLHALSGFRERMHEDRDHFDSQVAGVWVWGISCWIGDNWCRVSNQRGIPYLHKGGKGVNSSLWNARPVLGSQSGVHGKRPRVAKGGVGTHRQLPNISGADGAVGRGVHSKRIRDGIFDYMRALRDRLRRVRVCCGDWARVLGPAPTTAIGVTAVLLDPPYGVLDREEIYNHDSQAAPHQDTLFDVGQSTSDRVRAWAIEHGVDTKLRVALCGYDGEHDVLEKFGWDCVAWTAPGGYGSRNKSNLNRFRERIWFSPHCLGGPRA